MWTPGGQPDLIAFGAVRGGGKGGGGGQQQVAPPPQKYVDPVNGMSFTDDPTGFIQPGQPMPTTQWMSGADKLNQEIQQRQAGEKATSDKAAADAAAKAAQAQTDWDTSKNNAYNDAYQQAIRAFQGQGIGDPTSYLDKYINPALKSRYDSIQNLSPNPSSAFTNIGSDIVNQALADKRQSSANTLNSMFAPNYATTAISDTMGDPSYAKILGEQFDPLNQQLINAQKRGTLTDAGYAAALNALNQKKSAAQSTLQNLGSNIIASNRQGINDLISGARTAANNQSLADTFDPTAYGKQASDLAAKDTSGFEGALRNAVGGTQFADLTDLMNAGGAVQGATNPVTGAGGNPLSPVGAGPDQTTEDQKKRGLGSTGAF